MFYTGQSVEVLRGQYKGTKGIVTNYAGLNTFFTIQKEDGTKLKVHYKDMLEFNTAHKREVGDLAFLRKGIMFENKMQSFTLCEIVAKESYESGSKTHIGKVVVKTLNNDEIEVNCNAVLSLDV